MAEAFELAFPPGSVELPLLDSCPSAPALAMIGAEADTDQQQAC